MRGGYTKRSHFHTLAKTANYDSHGLREEFLDCGGARRLAPPASFSPQWGEGPRMRGGYTHRSHFHTLAKTANYDSQGLREASWIAAALAGLLLRPPSPLNGEKDRG